MTNLERVSIVLHGQIREETQGCIDSVELMFPHSEVIFCVSKSDDNFNKISIPDRFHVLFYDEPPLLQDYGFISRNYLKQFYPLYLGVTKSREDYVLKIRSDINIKDVILKGCDTEPQSIDYFHFSGEVRPIYVYPYNYNDKEPYFYGDMAIFGHKESLSLLFRCNNPHSDYVNLSNTDIFPCQLPSPNISFLSPEEILYLSFVKKVLSRNGKDLGFNDLLFNQRGVVDTKLFIRPLNIKCVLPERIDKYFRSIRHKVIRRIRVSCLLSKVYNLIRKHN